MKVITAGHAYELDSFEGTNAQHLQFIHKERAPEAAEPPSPAQLVTVKDGTTNEEVLRALINRLQFLGNKLPSRENSIAQTHLETALLWLEKRTADRKARGVEGTHAS